MTRITGTERDEIIRALGHAPDEARIAAVARRFGRGVTTIRKLRASNDLGASR